ncbi:hypothetical protein MBLNU13_g04031t1 [Cladosporium sp. NU13]
MASNNTTTAGSTAGLDIDWDTVVLFIDCEQCGGQYDAIADKHESMCGVCQILFGGYRPANVPTAAATTPAVTTPGLREGHLSCKTCKTSFRPTSKNNGADCTKCCNRQASEGYDVFARYGQQMTPQARENLRQYHQRLTMPAIAPIATMRRATSSAAPIFSAQHATIAPVPRKRATESENEQILQQNEPTAKRSKTSQQQATTMPTEHAEILPTAAGQTTQPGEFRTEFRNMLQAAINEMDEQPTK